MLRVESNIRRNDLMRRGYGERVVDRAIDDIEKAEAKRAWQLITEYLERVLRHPTGFYESNVTYHKYADGWTVDDNGVVYGPWLEGVGSRNHNSRFKGYSHFRRAQQRMARESFQIADRMLDREMQRYFG